MITKRMLTAFLSAALLLPVFAVTAVNGAENREVYDLNELSVFSGRTKEQLGQKYGEVFAQGPTYDSKDQSTWYSVMPSQQKPYEPGRLTDDTRRVMLAMTNYCRWLVGTTAYDHSNEHSDDLQAGALVRNFQFAHKVDDSNKPADMSDELWNQGKNASHNIIARGYTPDGAIAGWMNEGYSLSNKEWGTLGHRDAVLSDEYDGIQYGYSGFIAIGKIDYDYWNPSENMEDDFYAFPSPGYFPQSLLNPSRSPWEVNIKSGLLTVPSEDDVAVTITNLRSGVKMERGVKDDTVKVGDGYIVFVQPDDATANQYSDSYRVEISGFQNAESGRDALITYTVDFFDVKEYSPTSVRAMNYDRTYVIYKSLNDTESLRKIGGVLPKKLPFVTKTGYICEAEVNGEWVLDEENQCWRNSANPGTLPELVDDRNGVLNELSIPYRISDSYFDSYNYFTITPGRAQEGESAVFRVNRVNISTDVSEVYRLTSNEDGTCSGELRFCNLTSPEFAQTGNHHTFTVDSLSSADSGEYLSVYYNSGSAWTEIYVGNRFQKLSVEHHYTSEIVRAPSYYEPGLRKYICGVCGDSYTEELPALTPPPGDVNLDGRVTVEDATCVQKAQVEVMALDEVQRGAADVNRDGSVDITDATMIQMYAAELIHSF